MNTKLVINSNYTELQELSKGDWFIYNMPDESKVIAIKGDDTVYNDAKIMCMRVEPMGGILSRLNNNLQVELIKNINITY